MDASVVGEPPHPVLGQVRTAMAAGSVQYTFVTFTAIALGMPGTDTRVVGVLPHPPMGHDITLPGFIPAVKYTLVASTARPPPPPLLGYETSALSELAHDAIAHFTIWSPFVPFGETQ